MAGSSWTNQLQNLIILAAASAGFSGFFAYSPTPGHGNLFMSLAAAAGTDPYANSYPLGLSVGKPTDASQIVLSPSASGGSAALQFTIPGLSLSNVPNIVGGPILSTYASLVFSGPAMTGALIDDWVQIITYSNDTAGTFARGELRYIDTGGGVHTLLDWGKSDQAIHIPAGGGPFISGETFHSLSLSGILSGRMRVKKLPWNSIWLDAQMTTSSTSGGTSISVGTLPDSTYYPTADTHLPLSLTGASFAATGSFLGTPRVHVPTSGNVTVEIPSLSAAGALTLGCDAEYPTN